MGIGKRPLFISIAGVLLLVSCTKSPRPSVTWQVIGTLPQGRSSFSAVVSYSFPVETSMSCDPLPCGSFPLPPIEKIDIDGATGLVSKTEVLRASLWKNTYWNTTFTVNNGYLYAFMAFKVTGTTVSTFPISYYAHINADGTIGTWQAIANPVVDNMRYFSPALSYGNWIYSLGGFTEVGYGAGLGISTSAVSDVLVTNVNPDGSIGTWQTTTSMLEPRGNFQAIGFSGWIYAIGGQTPTGVTNTVEMAQVLTDGTLGGWVYTNPLNMPREGAGVVEHNGYIYVIGGGTDVLGTNTVEMAKINPDGTLGRWSYTSNLNVGRTDFNAVVVNGRIYAISTGTETIGWDTQTIEYADIQSDGTLGRWQLLPASGFVFSWMFSIAYQNYLYLFGGGVPYFLSARYYQPSSLYVIGGNAPTVTTSIAMATIDGPEIGTWKEAPSLWEPREGLSSATNMGFVYAVGGEADNEVLNDMEVTYPTDATGTLGKGIVVDATNGMPTGGGAISTGCDLCIIGGAYNGLYSSDVRCASLFDQVYPSYPSCAGFLREPQAHNGIPMGEFITSSVLNTSRYKMGVVMYPKAMTYPDYITGAGYISWVYVLGGYYTGTSITNSVEMAQVQTDGTLGQWQYTSPMNLPRAGFAAVAISGWVYAVGGYTDKGITNSVEKAPIDADGTLGKWVFTTPLVIPRADLAVVEDNGWIYALGGVSKVGGPPLDTIEALKATR